MGLHAEFAKFGAVGQNPMWSWSARSPDGQTVVITVWSDLLDYSRRASGGPIVYTDFISLEPAAWMDRPGNKERLGNLLHARDVLKQPVNVVVIDAVDVNADPRSIAPGSPRAVRWRLEIKEINEVTGQFWAEIVP